MLSGPQPFCTLRPSREVLVSPVGEMLAGWEGGALPCAAAGWGPSGSSFPQGNGRKEKRECLWSSVVVAMRSVESNAGTPEHPPCSGPSPRLVDGLCRKILQNRVEGPSVRVASRVLACVCAEDGGTLGAACAVSY